MDFLVIYFILFEKVLFVNLFVILYFQIYRIYCMVGVSFEKVQDEFVRGVVFNLYVRGVVVDVVVSGIY